MILIIIHTTPNLPTNITPASIARLKLSGKFPAGLGIPPLKFKIKYIYIYIYIYICICRITHILYVGIPI